MEKQVIEHKALGTTNVLTIFDVPHPEILQKSIELIDYYDDLLTISRPVSEVIAINQNAGLRPTPVSHATYNLVKTAIAVSHGHAGFNALIGPLVNLWHIGYSDAKVPTPAEISAQLDLMNPDDVEFDDQNQTIFLTKPKMELDLGGIGKGYIADRIQNLWEAYDVKAGIINLGGNLLFFGDSPNRPDGQWVIGIQDPNKNRNQNLLTVTSRACSAVTSGIYERTLTNGMQTYHHILDPQTGYPKETNLLSVTVFTKTSLLAEIKTTELFFTEDVNNKQFDTNFYGAVFVTKDHQIIVHGLKHNQISLENTDYELIIAK